MNLMGAIPGSAGRHDLAAEWMRKAIQLQPRDPYYRRNYITALLSLDRVDDAAEAVQKSLQLLPGDAHLLTLRGVVLSRQGEQEAAAKALEAAVEIAPQFALAHFNLSEVYRRQKKDAEGTRASEESDRVGPQQRRRASTTWRACCSTTGEFIESLRYLQRFLQVRPRSAQGYCNLSVAMGAAGDVPAVACLSSQRIEDRSDAEGSPRSS